MYFKKLVSHVSKCHARACIRKCRISLSFAAFNAHNCILKKLNSNICFISNGHAKACPTTLSIKVSRPKVYNMLKFLECVFQYIVVDRVDGIWSYQAKMLRLNFQSWSMAMLPKTKFKISSRYWPIPCGIRVGNIGNIALTTSDWYHIVYRISDNLKLWYKMCIGWYLKPCLKLPIVEISPFLDP